MLGLSRDGCRMSTAEREHRYADALQAADVVRYTPEGPWVQMARVVMAVADAEQAELRAEVDRLTRSLAMREGALRDQGGIALAADAIPCCSHCKHPVAELGHEAPCDICLMVRWATIRTNRVGE